MPDAGTPLVRELSELVPGVRASAEFQISEAQMQCFAELSGDRNPLHLDADFARARGHAGPVVYGGLLVAQISRMIGMELPGRDALWTGLEIDFLRPLHVGESARLDAEITHQSEAVRALELRLTLSAGSRTLAKGRAQVSLLA